MWRKSLEQDRLKKLRKAAQEAMAGRTPWKGDVRLALIICADASSGDLDNFITGLCDGLMAAHHSVAIQEEDWGSDISPHDSIVYKDDKQVVAIQAERRPMEEIGARFSVTVYCEGSGESG